jgi:quercetin dioxygenase-like cupin family protein
MKPLIISASDVEATSIGVAEGTSMQTLIPATAAPDFSMRRFTIKAGGSMPNHTNTVDHEQYVLSGSAEVGIGEETYRVKKDDALFVPAGVPHWYKASADEDYVFLCLIANREDTIVLVDAA